MILFFPKVDHNRQIRNSVTIIITNTKEHRKMYIRARIEGEPLKVYLHWHLYPCLLRPLKKKAKLKLAAHQRFEQENGNYSFETNRNSIKAGLQCNDISSFRDRELSYSQGFLFLIIVL